MDSVVDLAHFFSVSNDEILVNMSELKDLIAQKTSWTLQDSDNSVAKPDFRVVDTQTGFEQRELSWD